MRATARPTGRFSMPRSGDKEVANSEWRVASGELALREEQLASSALPCSPSTIRCSPSQLICIDPARVHEFWPHVSPLIAAAMERGAITDFADVAEAVCAGHALIWIAWNGKAIKAAAVTELSAVNGTRFCTLVACGASP